MIVSHNEIVVASLKAFEALGLALGQREDAAESIGWLALHQQPFEDHLASGLNQFSLRPNLATQLSHSAEASAWDAQGISAIHIFPMLIDYAASQCTSVERHTLSVINIADLDLMWPYITKPMMRGLTVDCRWHTSAGLGRIIASDDEGFPILYWVSGFKDGPAEGEVHLTIMQGAADLSVAIPEQVIRIDKKKSLLDKRNETVQNGIQIDQSLWEKVTSIGKGILVESTEESEKRGAGGV